MQQLNQENQTKTQTHYLWWLNPQSGKRHNAGVAFFSDEFSEFRLKLDCFPQNQFYLKAIGAQDQRVEYRAEIVQKRQGKFVGRRPVGIGYSNQEGSEVHIELRPFTNLLVLDL